MAQASNLYPSLVFEPYVYTPYPRWLYRQTAKGLANGEEPLSRLVADAEAQEAVGIGWHETPDAAIAAAEALPPVAATVPLTEEEIAAKLAADRAEMEREELYARAAEAGIVIDKRWKTERIREAVETATT